MAYYLPASLDPRGPIGEGGYTIQDGDCIESIAYLTGHIWQTIWNHPRNTDLKASRASHNILVAGDQIFIPDKVEKTVDCPTDARHTFVRKGVHCKLRVCILEAGIPRAHEHYRLVIDDVKVLTGTTDGEGWIEVAIPANAQKGDLMVGENPLQPPYALKLGGMDPITETKGLQKRLRNLGYNCQVTGKLDDATQAALAMFQKGEDLDATGKPDSNTLKKLKKRFGS